MSSSDATDRAAVADKLKLEGNALFHKQDYEGACQKYTKAIEQDPKNAIFYSNRAAAYLAFQPPQYLDAANDCEQASLHIAVALAPGYAKAWARLAGVADVLESFEYSARAWQKALDGLPQEGEAALTAATQTLKAQYEAGLKKAREGKVAYEPTSDVPNTLKVDAKTAARGLPWERAKKVAASKTLDKSSSAFVLLEAYEQFKEGLDTMAACKVQDTPQGPIMMGRPNAIEGFSSAILADERVFHIKDAAFPDMVRRQCLFENQLLKGWAESGGPEVVKRESVERLKVSGWATVRPALAITVRVWVFSAYFRSELAGHRDAANAIYTQALDVMDWGRKKWAKEPKEVRGSIFEKSFARGVKRLKMLNMHKAIAGGGPSAKWTFSVDDLVKLAQEIVDEVDADPIPSEYPDIAPGHVSSFWPYTKGGALSILGWHNLKTRNYRRAAEYYRKSGECYPEDDENHPYLLRMSLDCLCEANAPLKETLPLCKLIRITIPRTRDIWQISSTAGILADFLKEVQKFEFKQLREIDAGNSTMDSVVRLNPVLPPKFVNGKARAG